jgi:epoxyqueuosine reductase QueG
MPYYCPIPQKDDLADDIKIVCTTHDNPKWGCDECPDLSPWRKLHHRRKLYIDRKLAVHRPAILKNAKERVKP